MLETEDDASLLRRFAASRAQDAFAEFVRRHMDAVYSAALRRVGGDAHLAQDTAQQVFVTAAQRARELAGHPVLAGWLHTATRNAAVNLVRTESRRRRREQEAHAMDEALRNTRREIDWVQVAPVLDAAIDELGVRDRAAVLLRFFDRRTFAEVGAALQLTEDAARMRVDRAVDKLRALLARRGIASTGAALAAALAQHTVTAAPAGFAVAAAAEALSAAPVPAPWFDWARMERVASFAAPAALLVALGVAEYARESNRDAAAAVEAERRALASASARLRDLETRAADRAVVRVGESAERATGADGRLYLAPSASDASGPGPRLPASDPAQRLSGGRRLEIASAYDAFYRSAGLSPAQIERFEALRLRTSGAGLWLYESAAMHPGDSPPTATPLPAETVEAELRVLLGPEAFASYRAYERVLPGRHLAAQLASAVYLSDPLTVAQADRLAQLIAGASPAYRAGGAIDRATLDWEAVLHQSAAVLSPAQQGALGGVVRKKESFHQAMVARLRREASPPVPVSSGRSLD